METMMLGFIALATTFCAISLTTMGFIVFKLFYGYKEFIADAMEWYLDEMMPMVVEKTVGNLFKDEENKEETEE